MSVNIAVCGKFHYHNFVRYVERAGVLNRFYYAARITTGAADLGIAPDHAVNAWLKEYLIHGHCRVLGQWGRAFAFPLYHRLWQRAVLARWKPARLLHFLLHGNCLPLIRRAREEGAGVLGEPVNAHPQFLRDLIDEEHVLLGIRPRRRPELDAMEQRMLEEAATADHLIAGSPIVKRSYVERGFDAARFHVLPYGVDLRYFNPPTPAERAQGDGKFRVVCVAQITPRKGHAYLLEAWKRLALPDAELLLVGRVDEAMRPVLARYQGLYKHLPSVPNRSLRVHYGRSSVFALPSVEDGFAYVVAEALACGLPVVTTENTGAAGILSEGKDAFVVPIRSADALAERIERLYRDRTLREEMGAAALAKSQRELSWESYTERLLKFYRSTFSLDAANVSVPSATASGDAAQAMSMRCAGPRLGLA